MADKKKSNIKDQEQTNIVNETLDPKEKEQIQKLEAEANAIHESAQLLLDSEPNKQNPKQANSEDKSQQSVEKIQENHQNNEVVSNTENNNNEVLEKKENHSTLETIQVNNAMTENAISKSKNDISNYDKDVSKLKTKVNSLLLLLVLAIAGGAYGGYYQYAHKYDDLEKIRAEIDNKQSHVQELETKVNNLYNKIQEKDARIDSVFAENADLKAQNNALKSNEETLIAQVKQALESTSKVNIRLNNYEDRNPNDWLIAQSFFLVSNAENTLDTSDNIEVALLNLEQADLLLVKIDDPKIAAIREAIANDVMALKNLPSLDIKGLAFKLDSVYNNTDNMPLNEFLTNLDKQNAFKKAKGPTNEVKDWKENLLSSVKEFSSRFIEVRRRDDTVVNQFLSPDQTKILLKNIKTEILLAKVALYNQDEGSYKHNLEDITKHINAYYDVNNEIVKNNLEVLKDLSTSVIKLNKPEQLTSFKLFANVAKEQFHLYKAQKKQVEVTND